MAKKLHQAEENFIVKLGAAAQAEGMPPIAGRLMAVLMLADEPQSFDALAETLRVSRGSVSTNTRLLEGLGILERVNSVGDRRDYYRIVPDPYGALVQGQMIRMRRLADVVSEARMTVPSGRTAARGRLEYMERFYRYAITNTEAFLAGWRREMDATGEPPA